LIKVIIADDDSLIRLILKKTLNEIEYVRVVGEAEDGLQLMRQVRDLSPDVVFIDVDMPKADGVKAAEDIFTANPDTFLIFATAHHSYTHDAFRVYAFDYLLKPFKIDRIRQTMERIRKAKEERDASICLNKLLTKLSDTGFRISIRSNGKLSFVDTQDIVLVTRRGRKTVIVTRDGTIETTEPLRKLDGRLKNDDLFRCHKGYIVNIAMITEMMPWGNKTYLVKLANTSETALMTVEKAKQLKDIIYGKSASS